MVEQSLILAFVQRPFRATISIVGPSVPAAPRPPLHPLRQLPWYNCPPGVRLQEVLNGQDQLQHQYGVFFLLSSLLVTPTQQLRHYSHQLTQPT